jgi:hypothetical protein
MLINPVLNIEDPLFVENSNVSLLILPQMSMNAVTIRVLQVAFATIRLEDFGVLVE